jgi:hypothetical protein
MTKVNPAVLEGSAFRLEEQGLGLFGIDPKR